MPPAVWESPTWLRALTLAERRESLVRSARLPSLTPKRADWAEARARRWRFQFPFLPEEIFQSLSATHGLPAETLAYLAAEPLQTLAGRHREKPAWLIDVMTASATEFHEVCSSRRYLEDVELSGL